MERIESYEALSQRVSAHLTRGVRCSVLVTQDPFAPLAAEGRLYAAETPDALLLLQDWESHYRLHFFLHDLEQALPLKKTSKPVMAEIPFRPRDTGLQEAAAYLEAQGFRRLFTRCRLARGAGQEGPPAVSAVPAAVRDASRVQTLLRESFSPLTGCLPDQRELEQALAEGRILLLEEDGKLSGLLHYTLAGRSSEIRHLALRRERRGRGLTRPLLAQYLARTAEKKHLVWAREDDPAAQRAYAAQGYTPDGWRSIVLCWD